MKIAYCIPSCHHSGGMERVLSLKANYLANNLGYDVTIITTEEEETLRHYDFSDAIHFVNLGVRYNEAASGNLLSKAIERVRKASLHRKRLSEFLIQGEFDVCVSMFCHEMPFLWKLRDKSKKVLELHFSRDFRMLDIRHNGGSVFRRLLARMQNWRERRVVKHYDSFVVLTRQDAGEWQHDAAVHVIPNPLTFQPHLLSECREHKAIAIGRLCPQKGFDLLIDAWRQLPVHLKNGWTLSIYGSGPDEEKLISLVNRFHLTDRVRLCSPVTNIQEKLLESSLFCFSSRYEGFGMALMEAMSCGLPPVSFDCPCGPREIVTHEENGLLADTADVESFKLALQNLMENEDKRRDMGQRAAQSVREQYAISTIMSRWNELFHKLVNSGK